MATNLQKESGRIPLELSQISLADEALGIIPIPLLPKPPEWEWSLDSVIPLNKFKIPLSTDSESVRSQLDWNQVLDRVNRTRSKLKTAADTLLGGNFHDLFYESGRAAFNRVQKLLTRDKNILDKGENIQHKDEVRDSFGKVLNDLEINHMLTRIPKFFKVNELLPLQREAVLQYLEHAIKLRKIASKVKMLDKALPEAHERTVDPIRRGQLAHWIELLPLIKVKVEQYGIPAVNSDEKSVELLLEEKADLLTLLKLNDTVENSDFNLMLKNPKERKYMFRTKSHTEFDSAWRELFKALRNLSTEVSGGIARMGITVAMDESIMKILRYFNQLYSPEVDADAKFKLIKVIASGPGSGKFDTIAVFGKMDTNRHFQAYEVSDHKYRIVRGSPEFQFTTDSKIEQDEFGLPKIARPTELCYVQPDGSLEPLKVIRAEAI